ncbi:MAG: hypothetical protein ABI175_24955, partial [Polyangiales bacterium]
MPDSPTSDPDAPQRLPPALPAGLAHLASLWAPVIRDTGTRGGDADRPLQRPPLVQVAGSRPLPQFPVPLHLEVELARALPPPAEISDTDPTRKLVDASDTEPTRKIVDSSDTDVTVKRASVSDAELTRRRPMSSAPPPMMLEASGELDALDLDELEEPDELAELAMLSRLEDLDELTPDSTRQLHALRRQQRVRRSASRVMVGLLAIGAVVLGFAVVRVGQATAARAEADSVIHFSLASFT